jgi:N-acetylmuramoyl-L-alanine amidase
MAQMRKAESRSGQRWVLVVLGLLALLGRAGDALAVAAKPGRIERVRYEADGTSTRVIIMLSRPVPFEVRVLVGEVTRRSERRVVLDFSNATLGPGASAPIGVENGLLQQIRTGQFTARTARVVLDMASVTKHTVTAFESPPRVVVDIAGKPSAPLTVAAESPRDTGKPAPAEVAPLAAPLAPAPPRHDTPPVVAKDLEPARPATDRPSAASEAGNFPAPGPRAQQPLPETSPERAEARPKPEPRPDPNKATAGSEPLPGRPTNRPWRIVLDPGHGGADPGAQGVDGLLEKDVVLAIAQRLKRRLEETSNAKVLLTREADATRTLAERTAFANANSADLFISIHANADRAGELQGIETYTLNNSNDRATIRLAKMENGPSVRVGRGDLSFILSDMVQSGKEEESNALAERLHSRVLARLRSRYTDVHNLGVKKGPFYVLVGAYMPCVLIETSFLSHPVEGKRLGSTPYQNDIAEGLYLGITDFLGDARLAKTL